MKSRYCNQLTKNLYGPVLTATKKKSLFMVYFISELKKNVLLNVKRLVIRMTYCSPSWCVLVASYVRMYLR
jgi:hypothetical protein